MAEVIRYVNLASTAGGDGTTNATAGANRAYASASEAESATQSEASNDFVSAGNWYHIYCEGGADSTTLTISGTTTGASNYWLWDASNDPNTDGILGSSGYRLTDHIICADDYVRFKFIQVIESAGSWTPFEATTACTGEVYMDKCLMGDGADRTGNSPSNAFNGAATYYVNDCLFVCRSTWSSGSAVAVAAGTAHFFSCTAVSVGAASASEAWLQSAGTANTDGCAGYEISGTAWSGTWGGDYNAGSDATAPGANAVDNITTAAFNNYASYDFTAAASGALDDAGFDYGADADYKGDQTDFFGNARDTTWSIGFTEPQAAGGGSSGTPSIGSLNLLGCGL